LDKVINGSAKLLNSLALGKVVLISSCLNNELAILLNSALRWLLFILNFLPDLRCLIIRRPNVNVLILRVIDLLGYQAANFPIAYPMTSLLMQVCLLFLLKIFFQD